MVISDLKKLHAAPGNWHIAILSLILLALPGCQSLGSTTVQLKVEMQVQRDGQERHQHAAPESVPSAPAFPFTLPSYSDLDLSWYIQTHVDGFSMTVLNLTQSEVTLVWNEVTWRSSLRESWLELRVLSQSVGNLIDRKLKRQSSQADGFSPQAWVIEPYAETYFSLGPFV